MFFLIELVGVAYHFFAGYLSNFGELLINFGRIGDWSLEDLDHLR